MTDTSAIVAAMQAEQDETSAAEHGINAEEWHRLITRLNRKPNLVELGIYSVMWSEHCSYKSSRRHLSKFPTKNEHVIQGPGENAGVIDIGDGQAAIFKMESHNHPSYIEPYQGAATGVGGILRDVFTMGARPIALVNALRFGDPSHPKTRSLVAGVVAGIGGYGNCVGVPTVAGETEFHEGYNGNILVNAMAVGLADQDKIFYARGATPGNPIFYVGSKTGRDGIHGATMASAEFSEGDEEEDQATSDKHEGAEDNSSDTSSVAGHSTVNIEADKETPLATSIATDDTHLHVDPQVLFLVPRRLCFNCE